LKFYPSHSCTVSKMAEEVKKYYRDRVLKSEESSLQWQVGKTVNGVDVPIEQIEMILGAISGQLQLCERDNVLDIGCGNGLLTREIASRCSRITGVEITPELYEIAGQRSARDNITYINQDILAFLTDSSTELFTKVYFYEVQQHFTHQNTDELLGLLSRRCAERVKIFIGGIPDISRKWNFFNSPERVKNYYSSLVLGGDPIGTWFDRNFFEYLAGKYGFKCKILEQNANLYTSHYRYDCLFER